jgi:trigger factor
VSGEEYEGNVVDKYLYEMGKGLMPTDFDRGLLGLETGAETRIEFEIPEGSSNEDFVGKTAEFDVTVHEIKEKVLPELDDEFAANAGGFESMEELRNDIKTKLDEAKATGRERACSSVRSAPLSPRRLEGEVPEAMLNGRRQSMLGDFIGGLEARGMSFEQYARPPATTASACSRTSSSRPPSWYARSSRLRRSSGPRHRGHRRRYQRGVSRAMPRRAETDVDELRSAGTIPAPSRS